ncbi:MAG: hypothetical protein ACLQVN_27680 [Bryobacteraceae bacterium]
MILRLAEAVEALRRDATPETGPVDPAEEALAKVEKAMQAAVAGLKRLQTMELTDEAQVRLLLAVQGCADQLDLVHLSTGM